MAETNIEWAHYTFNPWRGCTKVSTACDICYAETLSKRNPGTLGVWGKYGTRAIAAESYWKLPVKWNREAEAAGERRRVFCASLADVFEGAETMPSDAIKPLRAARERLAWLIKETPSLDWLLLTKRPENVMTYDNLGFFWGPDGLPENVWIGTTVENQKYADIRIPELLKIPAKVRFLSVEPMVGPVNLEPFLQYPPMTDNYKMTLGVEAWRGVEWIICGGESGGQKARPMGIKWVRSIRDQCVAADVPFFFKQWGQFSPTYEYVNEEKYRIEDREIGDGLMLNVGKHKAGRVLDGRTWDELPEVSR